MKFKSEQKTKKNYHVQITFGAFETEEYEDFVTILDGGPAENASIVMAILSGAKKPETLVSSTNVMVVRFSSDAQIHGRGFEANWRAGNLALLIFFKIIFQIVSKYLHIKKRKKKKAFPASVSCGGHLKAQPYGQTFASPDYPGNYPNGVECVWKIDAHPGQLISLDVC